MKFTEQCLSRPIAVMLLWIAVMITGGICWARLPVAALPSVEMPTIRVNASLSGASPETMASSVATPLEKNLSTLPGLSMLTSSSMQGATTIVLEFDPSVNINSAAVDVQSALYQTMKKLPSQMTTPPSFRKINPADAPIAAIAIDSPSMTVSELNRFSDTLISPALSTINGVGEVTTIGQKRYAVRVEVDPIRLAAMDLTLTDVASAVKAANDNSPVGELDGKRQMMMLQTQGDLHNAADFAKVIIATHNGQPVHLADVASVQDSIENTLSYSSVNGHTAIVLNVFRQPAANIVATLDAIKQLLPKLQSQMPSSVKMQLLNDRSIAIRHAISDVSLTLLLTIALVIMVIMLFLRHFRATLIPALSIPASLLGAFAFMYFLGMSLDNISLMGLTIAVGLVVDDAIVVLENIMRHRELGKSNWQATLLGVHEMAFTIVSISLSLIAVFIPIFFMPGTLGLLFHEFAWVVSLAILVSAVVSLTLIPQLVQLLMKKDQQQTEPPKFSKVFERAFDKVLSAYTRALDWAISHKFWMVMTAVLTLVMTVFLYVTAPKGFFPQEDIGQLTVNIDTPQDMSYQGRLAVTKQIEKTLKLDPSVSVILAKVDHDTTQLLLTLKDQSQRPPMAEVIQNLRAKTGYLPGVTTYFSPVQNLRIGGRTSKSPYQYTLQSVNSDSTLSLNDWANKLMAGMKKTGVFVGVNSDAMLNGLQAQLSIDRDKASLMGVNVESIRNNLYAAFGTQQISTIYAPEDSYEVIMEVSQGSRQNESDLSKIYVRSSAGTLLPITTFTKITRNQGMTAVNHQGQLPAITLSFDLAPGKSLSDATLAISQVEKSINMPSSVFGNYAGQAAVYQQSQTSQIWLILMALAVIYVILGVLYESWIHPLTILLGLPSAAVGALLALRLLNLDVTFIAMIGILLLIGIVKKNAIMMIDFALVAERNERLSPKEAIIQACIQRFRPIMMTTLCALMGALPIAFGFGAGGELRQPMGVAIVGGLLFSQLVTLFITPVLYLLFDKLSVERLTLEQQLEK